jgi:hypothetical protein
MCASFNAVVSLANINYNPAQVLEIEPASPDTYGYIDTLTPDVNRGLLSVDDDFNQSRHVILECLCDHRDATISG